MAPLDDKWFKGPTDISLDLASTLSAANLGYPVQRVLGSNGWDGGLVSCVGLELTPDNRKILRGQFMMRGPLAKDPIVMQAEKLWEKAGKEVTVSITLPNAADFDFSAGTLTSECLEGKSVKIVISKNDQVILPTDWSASGIGECCFRLVAHLDKASSTACSPKIRYTILCFPRLVEELDELSELARGTGWPGVKILEGEATLFPEAKGWGCPILPIIVPGGPLDKIPNLPSGAEFRYVIGRVMGTARMPTAMATCRTMTSKWKKLINGAEEYEERLPTVTWPETLAPVTEHGKQSIINM